MSWEQHSFSVVRPVDRAAAYRRFVRAVEDAVDHMGLGRAAEAAAVRDTDLRAMLDGRNGRKLPTDVGAAVAEAVGVGERRDAILAAVRELFGLFQPESDPDYIHRLEKGYGEFGDIGRARLAEHRRAARRG